MCVTCGCSSHDDSVSIQMMEALAIAHADEQESNRQLDHDITHLAPQMETTATHAAANPPLKPGRSHRESDRVLEILATPGSPLDLPENQGLSQFSPVQMADGDRAHPNLVGHRHFDHGHFDHGHSDHEHSDHEHSDHEHSDHEHAGHGYSDHEHLGHEHLGHGHSGHEHLGHGHSGHGHSGHGHSGHGHLGHDSAGQDHDHSDPTVHNHHDVAQPGVGASAITHDRHQDRVAPTSLTQAKQNSDDPPTTIPAVPPSTQLLQLEQKVLAKNDAIAAYNRGWFSGRGIVALNVMSSPGAGKTSLLVRTIRDLAGHVAWSVIEGDQATAHDAERIRATGCKVVQINTGQGCHLEANMVQQGYLRLSPPPQSILVIENVGNLVCPSMFDLGESARIAVLSVTEGEDKPIKYPHLFRTCDVVLLNKIDLLPYVPFDCDRCLDYLHQVNPDAKVFLVSALSGEGLAHWYEWLVSQMGQKAPSATPLWSECLDLKVNARSVAAVQD